MRSVLVYIAIYFGVFLVMHRMFRRWWYGLVGAVSAAIVSLAPQLLALGIWPTLLAASSSSGSISRSCVI